MTASWMIKLTVLRFFLAGFETYCILPTVWEYIRSLGQTMFFLALVVSAYNFGAVIASPLFGFITDRFGNPRFIFYFSCGMKVLAYIMYTVNISAYFPLFGRLISGLSDMGSAVLLGQVALQTDEKNRGGIFVLVESAYCLGSAFGPGIGSFISFRASMFGWEIGEGNSPGIVMTIIWLLFFILSLFLPKTIWVETGAGSRKINAPSRDYEDDKRSSEDERKPRVISDSRVICLIYIIFCSEAFSSTSTFSVPILALDHFHLQLIHTKLLFLNCTLFTLALFLCFHIASKYVEERSLFVIAFSMQIVAISFLMSIAFSWNQVDDAQPYILLVYICMGMPYFAYPFGNSILSKITDPENATFIQGVSYATVHLAIVVSRVVVSFAFTKANLIHYCFGMVILWLAGVIWYGFLYKRMVPRI